jgi:hypothetical protein
VGFSSKATGAMVSSPGLWVALAAMLSIGRGA